MMATRPSRSKRGSAAMGAPFEPSGSSYTMPACNGPPTAGGRIGEMPMLTRRSALMIGALATTLMGDAAQAQGYPDHPVKIVVPSPPAGSYDILGRVVADQLTKRMGQSFVVENRTGAGTVVGTKSVAAAAPDGY